MVKKSNAISEYEYFIRQCIKYGISSVISEHSDIDFKYE